MKKQYRTTKPEVYRLLKELETGKSIGFASFNKSCLNRLTKKGLISINTTTKKVSKKGNYEVFLR